MSNALLLYTTAGCHLCEQAEELLQALCLQLPATHWQSVDIADDDDLFTRYGWSIPVLRRADGAELHWPFNAVQLAAFAASD
jgi:hypothetical protein